MAVTLSFSPGQPCSGGEHITVQYTLGPFTRTLHIGRADLKNNRLTADEADQLALFVMRLLADQVGLSQVRTAIAMKVVDLTAVGV